jgi:hypothetical protein
MKAERSEHRRSEPRFENLPGLPGLAHGAPVLSACPRALIARSIRPRRKNFPASSARCIATDSRDLNPLLPAPLPRFVGVETAIGEAAATK